jgi:hypothetical protein
MCRLRWGSQKSPSDGCVSTTFSLCIVKRMTFLRKHRLDAGRFKSFQPLRCGLILNYRGNYLMGLLTSLTPFHLHRIVRLLSDATWRTMVSCISEVKQSCPQLRLIIMAVHLFEPPFLYGGRFKNVRLLPSPIWIHNFGLITFHVLNKSHRMPDHLAGFQEVGQKH